jgi:hypothetical protein
MIMCRMRSCSCLFVMRLRNSREKLSKEIVELHMEARVVTSTRTVSISTLPYDHTNYVYLFV